jgi:hypothetical protein
MASLEPTFTIKTYNWRLALGEVFTTSLPKDNSIGNKKGFNLSNFN